MENRVFRRGNIILYLIAFYTVLLGGVIARVYFFPTGKDDPKVAAWSFGLLAFALGIELLIKARVRLESDETGVRWRSLWRGFRAATWDEIEVVRSWSGKGDRAEVTRFFAPCGEIEVPNRAAHEFLEAHLRDREWPLALFFHSNGLVGALFFLVLTWSNGALMCRRNLRFFPAQGVFDPLFLGVAAALAVPLLWVSAMVIRRFVATRATCGDWLLLSETELVWRRANARHVLQIVDLHEVTFKGPRLSLEDATGQKWIFNEAPNATGYLLQQLAARRPDLESLRRYAYNDGRSQIAWDSSRARFSCRSAQTIGFSLALVFMAIFFGTITSAINLVFSGALDWIVLLCFGLAPAAIGGCVYLAADWWSIVVTPEGLEWHRPWNRVERAAWPEIEWRQLPNRMRLRVRGRERFLGETRAPLYLQTLIRERAQPFSGPPSPPLA